MIHNLISIINEKSAEIATLILDKRYFLSILGGIFFVGFVGKLIVLWNYKRMIKKAENMDNPKNNILRQIKTKFDSVKTVNGKVVNPILLVRRYIGKCRFGFVSLGFLDELLSWCAIICVGLGGISGYSLYSNGEGKTTAMSYILVSLYFACAMIIADKCIKTSSKKNDLVYIIADFFENSVNFREKIKNREINQDVVLDFQIDENQKKDKKIDSDQIEISKREREDKIAQQQIINEVLSEYLQ